VPLWPLWWLWCWEDLAKEEPLDDDVDDGYEKLKFKASSLSATVLKKESTWR